VPSFEAEGDPGTPGNEIRSN